MGGVLDIHNAEELVLGASGCDGVARAVYAVPVLSLRWGRRLKNHIAAAVVTEGQFDAKSINPICTKVNPSTHLSIGLLRAADLWAASCLTSAASPSLVTVLCRE